MDARQMGSFLLDQAMETCPELSFDSYDRLFPNQDTLPKGGFGNLIALPLQHQPRQQGGSVFVDAEYLPYPDQWQYLSQVIKVSPEKVAELVGKYRAQFRHQSIPEIELAPWETGLPQATSKIEGCPETVNVVLANQLYISADALPAKLLTRIKKLASFPNPVFFKTQAMRFSTQGIPRIITCARMEGGYLHLPRGCLEALSDLLESQGCKLDIEDKRISGAELKGVEFQGQLKKEQQKAVKAMMKQDVGVLHAPTAFGKTVTALALVAERKVNTLVLVHSRQLIDQWKERAETFLNLENVGVISGGRKKPTGLLDVATYQSLISKGDNQVNPLIFDYGHVIIDECHHLSAPRYELLLNEVRCRYVLGITATPHRQDGHQPIIHMQAGPVRHKAQEKQSEYLRKVIFRDTGLLPLPEWVENKPHISAVYQWLASNEERNQQIVRDVLMVAKDGRHPVILTERKEHAMLLRVNIKLKKGSFPAAEPTLNSHNKASKPLSMAEQDEYCK
ncbi:DEAD/DEAH box helicase family protein [Endozoicomonas sp. SCSIO W0465]|uniref:TOTE conflict system archaeo-eukaryotic primase domain-containing protein n=1 Tax=Endozoicomonas sp. SCSIO W0465 TaxID=2918516 RepID=UPI002074AF9F|nr:DEAD/DEAH box helicase family protein [Endozoicomonas sp. SCSIO W0465]USE35231.1 DEAD/DEAH box helicase family protein [Endozoicomonas sp. SCSIO W0465]